MVHHYNYFFVHPQTFWAALAPAWSSDQSNFQSALYLYPHSRMWQEKSIQSGWLVLLHFDWEPRPKSVPMYSAFSPHTMDEQSLLKDKAISNLCIRSSPFSPTQELCSNHSSLFLWHIHFSYHLYKAYKWIEISFILKKISLKLLSFPSILVFFPV